MAVKGATRSTYKPPTQYTFRQLEELWVGAGGPLVEAPTAAAIALAESGGRPNAEGHNTNGSIDRGLWQINSVHEALSTTNPVANAQAAVKLYKESHWSPWVTYNSGAYQGFLTHANLQSGIPLEKSAQGLGYFSQAIQAVFAAYEFTPFGSAVNAATKATGKPSASSTVGAQARAAEQGPEEALEKAPAWLSGVFGFLGKEVVTAVLLLAGAVLVVYGIMVAVRPRESAFSIPKPGFMPIPV